MLSIKLAALCSLWIAASVASTAASHARGRRALPAPVVISHHKCNGRANFGRTAETLPKFREAMKHQPISLDVYPYIAGSTILLPHMIARAERVMITGSKPHPECAGRDLDAIAREWGCTEPEAVERLQPAAAIYFSMSEDDLREILRFEHAMIGSDGLPGDPHPHPRLWGTFPRVLGHYVRELGLIPLEHAVHRQRGRLQLRQRGHVLLHRTGRVRGGHAIMRLPPLLKPRDICTPTPLAQA